MTDASRIITGSHKPDWYNAKLWEYVDRAVELGKDHGVTIGANTSYAYRMDEMKKRVEHLIEHGVKMIMAQGAPFLFQIAATEFLGDLKAALDG
jgi:lactam utilization protein B